VGRDFEKTDTLERPLVTSLLHGIGPWDVTTYLGAVVVLAVAGLLATLLPAIRAASIPPVAALQQD
jgi:ABC-type lipoprotein release transport system permease subunit